MSNYRDDREALRARAENLERSLEEKEREIARLKAAPGQKRLKDLAAAEGELARLKAEQALEERSRSAAAKAALLAVGVLSAMVAAGGGLWLVARPSPTRLPPPPVFPASPKQALASAAPAEARNLIITWNGHVKRSTAPDLGGGTPCVLSAQVSAKGTEGVRVEKLDMLCGTRPLYSTGDSMGSGVSNTSWSVREEQDDDGAFRHTITYQDVGRRSGRSEVTIDSARRKARVYSTEGDKPEVEIALDELGAPQTTRLYGEEKGGYGCKRWDGTASVTEVAGATAVKRGGKCDVSLRPRNAPSCNVRIECDGSVLYGTSDSTYATRDGDLLKDDAFSVKDKDPKLTFDFVEKTVTISDQALTSWSVKLRLDKTPPR